jgi:hypothetical protein
MTLNQQRAIALAQALTSGQVSAGSLSDSDWDLLLLAADLNNPQSLPQIVSRRVLDRAARGIGYFEGTGGCVVDPNGWAEDEWEKGTATGPRAAAAAGSNRMRHDGPGAHLPPGPWASPN